MSGNVVNMLAAKKVKLHGMKSSKWTTMDKINQYRGLIELYGRDKKIIKTDAAVNQRKTERFIKEFSKRIYIDRRKLDNAIRGDKQKLKNTLSVYNKELLFTYQNSDPKNVVEEIAQRNFAKRKVIDKLAYEKKMKSKRLIDLNLERSILEDRNNYKSRTQIKHEVQAQIITGKVQDAILRKDAAIAIYRIYTEILNIMKQDSLYFNAIIETVENDGYNQSQCFLGATKLGQIATEYLDDRKREYKKMEQIILSDMRQRKEDIHKLDKHVKKTKDAIKQLLRKDSDVGTCVMKFNETQSMQALYRELRDVQRTLNFLKSVTSAPSFDCISLCLEEQMTQHHRLKRLLKRYEKTHDTLQNKVNHAKMLNSFLETTMDENIKTYESKQEELTSTLNDLKAEKLDIDRRIDYHRNMSANIRVALRHFLEISTNIHVPDSKKKIAAFALPRSSDASENENANGTEIISTLISSFSILMKTYFAQHKENDLDEGYKEVEKMIQARMDVWSSPDEKISQTSLLMGLYTEHARELTREDIKKQGLALIAASKQIDDLIPMVDKGVEKYKK